MVPVLRGGSSIILILLLTRMRRIERRAIERLTAAGATTGERAILLDKELSGSSRVYDRLMKAGALVRTADDRYYLDQQAYDAFCARRRSEAWMVVAVLALIVALLVLFGVIS